MARTEISSTGGIGRPTLIIGNNRFHNWDIFSYDGRSWTLSVNRDGEVHLIPTTELNEATEIPQDEWVEFSPDEFEDKLGDEIIHEEEKTPLR